MSAILIKSRRKAQEDFFLAMAKMIHAPVKVLNENDEVDAMVIKSVEKGMKLGKIPKKEVKK
jgi:hypothetical protein